MLTFLWKHLYDIISNSLYMFTILVKHSQNLPQVIKIS